MKGGEEALPDYEMLELVLFLAQPRGDTKPLAKQLIARFGSYAAVISAEPKELKEIPGIGDAAVVALKTVRDAAVRLAREEIIGAPVLSSWQALIDYCRATMGHAKQEQFRLFYLNKKNVVIADELQQTGTVDHTAVYPREVVKRALELNASALILVHNHPSGDPTPSESDIDMTCRVQDAAEALGLTLHDHLIVGRERELSFRASGYL